VAGGCAAHGRGTLTKAASTPGRTAARAGLHVIARHPSRAKAAIAAVVASSAAMCSATAARASPIEPVAVISRAGPLDTHNGTSAGTSIMPAPCSVPTASDHSARLAWPTR
jgi:hypothetical protein